MSDDPLDRSAHPDLADTLDTADRLDLVERVLASTLARLAAVEARAASAPRRWPR